MKAGSVSAQILAPYADALMSLAQSQSVTERIGQDLRYLLSLLTDSAELRQVLASPVFKEQQKKAILANIVGDQVHPFTKNILMLLVDRRRIAFLEGVCEQYLSLLRKLNQTVLAEVTSAVELTEAQKQAVVNKVKAISNAQQVELQTKIDPELIGGVVIKVGDQIIDASIKAQLRRIGLRLSTGA